MSSWSFPNGIHHGLLVAIVNLSIKLTDQLSFVFDPVDCFGQPQGFNQVRLMTSRDRAYFWCYVNNLGNNLHEFRLSLSRYFQTRNKNNQVFCEEKLYE